MLRFLNRENIWPELQAISRVRDCPLFVAVPFLGSSGGKLLHLKCNDVLVVALTQANSRNGTVCPAEIERLQKKGVRVYLATDLHAKVVLCGDKVVIGSANLSQTSFTYLDEAALLTTDATAVNDVREWFNQRTMEEVSPAWLKICRDVYQPPRGGFGRTGKRIVRQRGGRAVWLMGVHPTDHPEDEAKAARGGAAQAKRELSDALKFKVSTVRCTGSSSFLARICKGDTVVQVWKTSSEHYAEELARVIGKRKTSSSRETPVTYLYLECPRRPKQVRWIDFKKLCLSIGLKLGKGVGTRELRNPVQATKLLAFVSRKPRQR